MVLRMEESSSIWKKPGVWIPLAISLGALAYVLVYAALFGTAYHVDERAPARIFQLLMLSEIPFIIGFAVNWLPRLPAKAGGILVLQLIAACVPVLTVLLLER